MVACRERRSPLSLGFKFRTLLSAQAFDAGMAGAQLTPVNLALISSPPPPPPPPPPQISGPPCSTFDVFSPFSSPSTPSQQNPSVSLPSLSMVSPSVESFPPLSRDNRIHTPVPDAYFLRRSKPLELGSGNLHQLKEFFPSSSGDAVDRPGSQSSKDEFPGAHSPSGPSQPSSVASKGGMRPDARGCRQYQPEVDSENASSPIACERNPILNRCGQSIGQIEASNFLSSEHCAPLSEGAFQATGDCKLEFPAVSAEVQCPGGSTPMDKSEDGAAAASSSIGTVPVGDQGPCPSIGKLMKNIDEIRMKFGDYRTRVPEVSFICDSPTPEIISEVHLDGDVGISGCKRLGTEIQSPLSIEGLTPTTNGGGPKSCLKKPKRLKKKRPHSEL